MITIIAVLSSLAHADPPATVYVDQGDSYTAVGPSFIIHEDRMNTLLVKVESYESCSEKLLSVSHDLEEFGLRVDDLLVARDEDSNKILELQTEINSNKLRLKRARNQRNIAIAVAGSLLIGAAAAVAIR